MTRWRQRMGEKRIKALLQESLSVAVKTGAMKPADTRQVIVDTTVQPKNVMFPTDAKLIHRARERLVRLARKAGLELRQTYVRVGKFALIQHQRYAHTKQFKRAGKAHKPYEFGVKVSVATTLNRSKGGQFALHTMALPGNPYDGHTLATVIPDMEQTIGNELSRILADAGYRGHNAPDSHKFRGFTAGQKRRVTPAIKRQMRRRSAVEPVIGHLKNEHRMDRNYLAGKQGDAVNALLAAVGYNFSLLLKWIRQLLCLITAIIATFLPKLALSSAPPSRLCRYDRHGCTPGQNCTN